MKRILLIFTTLILTFSVAFAKEPDEILISGESWTPYAFEENGKVVGIDFEIAEAIFTKLGVKYKTEILPWARC